MKTILVVDDSPLIRKAIRRLLEPLGFSALEAADGVEALEFMESDGRVDGILLDVEMPNMDGLTFLKTLRTRRELPQPIVVMCTTRCSADVIAHALGAGADEFVMKPFDSGILGAKLHGIGLVA